MISAVVLTKNEENNIRGCLTSLVWADEIVVIDDYSTDKTPTVAQKIGAKVYKRHLNGDFATQRNFGLKMAKGDWILFIDADERVTEALASEIKMQISKSKNDKVVGFFLKRKDFLWGRGLRYGETAKVRLLKLAKKKAGKWVRSVHETWQVGGKHKELKNPLLHYPHQTISEFLENINFFSTLHAQILFKEGIKTNLFQIIAYPIGKFLQNYIWRLGFLDGIPGLIIALMMSFHSFLARAKLYLLSKENTK